MPTLREGPEMLLRDLPVRQIAYAVPDVVAAAEEHNRLYGSGPFYLAEHVAVSNLIHRGVPATVDQSIAFGQWGDVMVEFIAQHNDAPSYIHDMYPYGSGRSGMHHVAVIVDDFQAALDHYSGLDYPLAARFYVGAPGEGFDAAFIDTRATNGHMIEIYPKCDPLLAAYQMCRDIAGLFSSRPMFEPISF